MTAPYCISLRSVSFSLLLAGASYVGCSTPQDTTADTTTTTTTVTGVGGGSSCHNEQVDGFCYRGGPAPEDCSCADCASAAFCTDKCNDNDVCENNDDGTEDCSCADCFFKVQGCSPGSEGCDDPTDDNYNPSCGNEENCTCPDCAGEPICNDNCVDNGECIPWLEGCSCSDCGGTEDCGGGGVTTTTGGGGGSGGAPGVGGGGTAGAPGVGGASAAATGAGGA